MSDVYRVAVALQMSSNHGAVLGALASGLIGAQHHVTKLNKGLAETTGAMTRLKLAIGGGLAFAGGTAILATLKNITDHTRELSKELATLKTQGLTPLQIKGADKAARAATVAVPGSTESGNLKLLSEANSLMGIENAKVALPSIARAVQVFGAIDGKYKQAEESLYSVLKSGEMLGKLQDEKTHLIVPEKLDAFLNVMARISAATGNRVNAQTMFGMVQQGAPALANMSDDGLTSMLMAAQQMGGPRAGTALSSMYQQFVGGTMTEARAKELKRLGLIGAYDVGRGGHLTFRKGALDTPFVKALEKNPLDAMKILTSSLEKGGFKTIEAQTKELFMILGRQTTQRLVSDFLRNMPNMIAEQGRINKGQGLEAQAKTRNEEDYSVVEHNMHEAWKNLMEAIGGPQSKAAITVMNQITGGLNYMTAAVRNTNPETLVSIGKGLAVLGASLTAGGSVALIAALGPAGWIATGIIGATAAFVAFHEPFEKWVKSTTGMGPALDAADAAFNKAALAFGEWVKAITPSAETMGTLAAKLVTEIASWPGRLSTAITEMGTSLVTAIGDMLKSLFSKLNPFSKTAFEGGDSLGGMIQKASFGGGGGGGGGGANDNYGGASGVARSLGRSGLGGADGGSGLVASGGGRLVPRGAFGPGTGAGDSWYEAVMRAEGTAGKDPYNVVLGNGRYGLPSKPLTDMSLAEAYQFGRSVRARHGSSSAIGAFQIVGQTMKTYMGEAGLGWNDKFSPENQRKLADVIRRKQGFGAWEGFKVHPGELRNARQLNPYGKDPAPTAGPPPKPSVNKPIMVDLHMDGRKMGRAIAMHQANDHLFPKAAGGMDTHGGWRAPGTPVTDAA